MKKNIKIFAVIEFLILLSALIKFEFFINLQVAFLSSFFIIVGSAFAYKRVIKNQVALENVEEKRDVLDEIEDPYELYEEFPKESDLDLKAIVKEEKKKIKILNLREIKKGARAGVSLYRLVPYLFLIIGFIALKNNALLDISIYLPSLLIGIVAGYFISKEL
ncbi:MAG: hypothetical protein WC390_00120 [Sulfurimonas sp.]